MLIDDILAGVPPDSQRSEWFLKQLKEAVVIKVHNVADHVFNNYPEPWKKGETLDRCSIFDSIAPPYETMWLEWGHRCDWGFIHEKPCQAPTRLRAGALISGFDISQIEDAVKDGSVEHLKSHLPGARWIMSGFLLWEGKENDGVLSCPPGFVWGVDPEGRLILRDGEIPCSPHPLSHSEELTDEDKRQATGFSWFLCIPFMALSLMHCKNVDLVKSPPLPEALQQARRKKGRPPLLRWHTLVVKPFGRARHPSNGHGRPDPLSASLHTCRGHYKRYKEGGGLFGRHHGVYWWTKHARGSAENGVVLKDYRVLPSDTDDRKPHEG